MGGFTEVAIAQGQTRSSFFAREGIEVGSGRRDPLLNGHLREVVEAVGGHGLG